MEETSFLTSRRALFARLVGQGAAKIRFDEREVCSHYEGLARSGDRRRLWAKLACAHRGFAERERFGEPAAARVVHHAEPSASADAEGSFAEPAWVTAA